MKEYQLLDSLRSPYVIEFLSIFPFFASEVFFISCIIFGYLLRPGGRLFLHLGFLIPASTLLNISLKNLFAISRPDLSLHLVPVFDTYGFPSGDVHVSAIFWGMIFLRTKMKLFKLVAVIFIALIMLSRVCLGVHSIADVFGGLAIAIITLQIWFLPYVAIIVESWTIGNYKNYWLIACSLILISFFVAEDYRYSLFWIAPVGCLLGYGVALPAVRRWQFLPQFFSNLHFFLVISFFILIVLIKKFVPLDNSNYIEYTITGIIKYAFIVILIYRVFPQVQHHFLSGEKSDKPN